MSHENPHISATTKPTISKRLQQASRLLVSVLAFSVLAFSVLALALPNAFADKLVQTTDEPYTEPFTAIVPYAFSSESAGFVLGVAGAFSSFPQEQSSLFLTALTSSRNAKAVYVFFNDYQLPFNERLFSDISLGVGDFPEKRNYFDLAYAPNQAPAGSNDSSADDYFQSAGTADWIDLDLKYLLNTGDGSKNPINIYTLHNGLLVAGATGGGNWNPFESGRSYVETRVFYQKRVYHLSNQNEQLTTSGIRLALRYENTDFPVNPYQGSKMIASITRDPGWGNNTDSWIFAEFEAAKYFPLKAGKNSEQRVFAISFWTGNSLSWQVQQTAAGPEISHRPPPYYGATLGGIYRLRAYPIERFNDRAAIYYGLEYRLIPKSEILRNIPVLKKLGFQWWEIVTFAEAGRVAPSWDLSMLHTRMKSDVGAGIRVMAGNNIGRFDVAVSSEQTTFWLMYGHPF